MERKIEIIRFACPNCGAPLRYPSDSLVKCQYCSSTIAIQEGEIAGRLRNQALNKSLQYFPDLKKSFKDMSEAFYTGPKMTRTLASGTEIFDTIIEIYQRNFQSYVFDPKQIDELIKDTYFIVKSAVQDVVNGKEMYLEDFKRFRAALLDFSFPHMRRGTRMADLKYTYEFRELMFTSQINLPKRTRFSLKYGHSIYTELKGIVCVSSKYHRYLFQGFLPAFTYLLRFLYYPLSQSESSNPSENRREFFAYKTKVSEYLISLMGDLLELKKNWIRGDPGIRNFLYAVSIIFYPYKHRVGILKKSVLIVFPLDSDTLQKNTHHGF